MLDGMTSEAGVLVGQIRNFQDQMTRGEADTGGLTETAMIDIGMRGKSSFSSFDCSLH